MRHIVFDTSTLVSAALRPDSTPGRALHNALKNDRIYVCESSLDELYDVLNRKKFDHYLDLNYRLLFHETLSRYALHIPQRWVLIDAVDPPCRDRNDNLHLALAWAAKAELLISSDQDLLCLHPWRGIPVLTPASFLALHT
jgi:hypothetical protein